MSKESTEQGQSGRQGAQAGQSSGEGGQPRQGSNRTEVYGAGGEGEPKHHFEPGHAPSEQGEKEHPSPDAIRKHQQGLAGSGTGHQGGNSAHNERSEEVAAQGEPQGEHTRHGRNHLIGDRKSGSEGGTSDE